MKLLTIKKCLKTYDKNKSFIRRISESKSVKKLKSFYLHYSASHPQDVELKEEHRYFLNRDILWQRVYDPADARAQLFYSLQQKQANEWGISKNLFAFMQAFRSSCLFTVANFKLLEKKGPIFYVAFADILLKLDPAYRTQGNLEFLMDYPDSLIALAEFLKIVNYRQTSYYIKRLIMYPKELATLVDCLNFFEVKSLTHASVCKLIARLPLFKDRDFLNFFNNRSSSTAERKQWFYYNGCKGLIELIERTNFQMEIQALQLQEQQLAAKNSRKSIIKPFNSPPHTCLKSVRFFLEESKEPERDSAPLTEAERANCHFF